MTKSVRLVASNGEGAHYWDWKVARLTVSEIFRNASVSHFRSVRWGSDVAEARAGVYLVARTDDSKAECKQCSLPFVDPFPSNLDIDFEYERERWLPNEAILYIGKTDQAIHNRVDQFYRQQCGGSSPHAGGQVVKLLRCGLWVFWAAVDSPYKIEQSMISDFKDRVGQVPFANWDRKRRRRRIRFIN